MRLIGITANGVAPWVFLVNGVAFVQAMSDPLAKDGATLPTEQLPPGRFVAVGETYDFESMAIGDAWRLTGKSDNNSLNALTGVIVTRSHVRQHFRLRRLLRDKPFCSSLIRASFYNRGHLRTKPLG
jgi:hypothetical protein